MALPLRLWPRRGSTGISPTAHYTGHVWVRNGLSHPELGTREGRLFFDALAPAMAVSRRLGGATLEGMLLARHRIIDDLLAAAIDDGRVSQVIEVACGMSPRGWRFAGRYGDRLTYVEADLPEMAARKRSALERMGSLGTAHRVVEIDALRDAGPLSLAAVSADLEPQRGLAIVTEGLLTYFPHDEVLDMWRRFAGAVRRFSAGLYVADVRLGGHLPAIPDRAFQGALSAFVGRRVHTHFAGESEAVAALCEAGFKQARLHRADRHPAAGEAGRDPASSRLHIIEATV